MSDPIDLLLITHDRSAYLEKTLARIQEDPADFRIHWWDNASCDATREILSEFRDPRIVERHRSAENVNQGPPVRWFLERAQAELVGKIDDDVLLPPGWTERLAPMVMADRRFGMLGCWMYMPEDVVFEAGGINEQVVSGVRLLRTVTMGGASFLARRSVLERFLVAGRPGIPIDRLRMTLDGFVSGYPLPLIEAHHMDDPRSPHCLMRAVDRGAGQSFTMNRLGFETLDEYAAWIAADARYFQETPFEAQLRTARLRRDRSRLGRLRWRLLERFGRVALPPGASRRG